jgi:hypothetical protein
MAEPESARNLTGSERLSATFLRLLPWLAFVICAFPLPAYFLWRYFTAAEGAGEYMLFALTSLGVGALVGLLAAVLAFVARRAWEGRLRERLARDGITASELKWFMREVPAERRRTLKQMEKTHPLLAEAYRDTLAADVTAARLLTNARREAEAVSRRLANAAQAHGTGRAELERNLQRDGARAERVLRETEEHRREIETRLQAIEAMASRDASERETELALKRLGSVRHFEPLGLSAAREESEAREEVERETRAQAMDRTRAELKGEAGRLQSPGGGEPG